MTIQASDFFRQVLVKDPWGGKSTLSQDELDEQRLSDLIQQPEVGNTDIDVSLALMDLVRDDLLLSGTGGGAALTDPTMRLAIRALNRCTQRTGQEFKLPFRDHTTWRAWWIRNEASGSWQARRDLLSDLFDEPYAKFVARQDRTLDSTLSDAISPHARLGWPSIDTEIGELRRHFRSATTPQDYRAIGNDCVHTLERLSQQVYNHDLHTPAGEEEPAVANTKLRLTRFIEARLPGSENAEMRKFARSAIELAQAVKHSSTPTRTKAGISADAVIMLANMLRRLDEPSE